jgi:hypothetical protein
MSLDPTETHVLSDAETLASTSLNIVKTAVDSLLGYYTAAVPQAGSDLVALLPDLIENLVPAGVRPYVTTVLNLAGANTVLAKVIAPSETSVTALLHIAKANVDAALNNIESTLPPPVTIPQSTASAASASPATK